ncbi:MAG: hypothetical protein RQ966_05165 [Acetobacteraceae bacterium]|nr:hypothetical protein [Acetobacteraceae bacterium]
MSSAFAQAEPPHAWLFGTWTGGLFPPPSNMTTQACFSQPVAIFTRDLVMRATLTDQTLVQRVIESARAVPGGADFRFAAAAATPGLFGTPMAQTGFGCPSPDELVVQKRGENTITFPGCTDFPYPLVRCH